MHELIEELGHIGIVPVIKIDEAEKALPLAQALLAGGIPCAEITFRTDAGAEAIRRIRRGLPELLVGAGTILSTEQVDRAVDAGAKFIVSPGFNPRVVAHCVNRGIPITPGCAGPSDMEAALETGLEVVKFFPAEQSGGLAYIKAVAAPFPGLKFMPTGGISAANIASYLTYEKIHACGGSWMATAELINAGNFDAITALCKEAVQKAHGFSLCHIGLNAADEAQAQKAAALFESCFAFSGGAGGQIVIAVNSVKRARAYLERAGLVFTGEKGGLRARGEIAGHAVELVQKK